MTRIATVEEPGALPGPLPLRDPTDLKTDRFGRLIVLAVVGPTASVPTVKASIAALTGLVSLKASPGVLFKAELAPSVPFAGQFYFQLFNKAVGAVVAGDIPDWSVAVRLADAPIGVFLFGEAGAEFTAQTTAAFSSQPFEFANAGLSANVSAIIL
jgi:hypothetical protein